MKVREIIMIALSVLAGALISMGIVSFDRDCIVISDSIGIVSTMPVSYKYRYDSMRYTQDNGNLIVELIYEKRGLDDE